MHSPVHVCYVQGVAQFERITLRNAAGLIFKKKGGGGGVGGGGEGVGRANSAKSSPSLPIHENAIR